MGDEVAAAQRPRDVRLVDVGTGGMFTVVCVCSCWSYAQLHMLPVFQVLLVSCVSLVLPTSLDLHMFSDFRR